MEMIFYRIFNSPFEQYAHKNGQKFTVLSVITEPDNDHDEEVLPMYRIRFANGDEIEAWPEEIGLVESWSYSI